MLFMRGKAMSGAPIISGTNQLPKPPISAGMMKKNTMIRPCAVTSTLNIWWSSPSTWDPGAISSRRKMIEKIIPITPAMNAEVRYSVPMSLWLVE